MVVLGSFAIVIFESNFQALLVLNSDQYCYFQSLWDL